VVLRGCARTLLVLLALVVLYERAEEGLLLAGQWLRHGDVVTKVECGRCPRASAHTRVFGTEFSGPMRDGLVECSGRAGDESAERSNHHVDKLQKMVEVACPMSSCTTSPPMWGEALIFRNRPT
jgi:hypothetical protein